MRGRVFSPASSGPAEAGPAAFRGSIRARMASETAIPASAPPLASNPAQNAPPMTAPGAGNHRQEEAGHDAGETGQDQEDSFRGDIDRAAARRDRAQARIPKKREDSDRRGDPNGWPPCFSPAAQDRVADQCMAPVRASATPERSTRRSETPVRRRARSRQARRARSRPRACPASWSRSRWRRGARATGSTGSPKVRLTMRPRFTAGRAAIASAQRRTFLYSCTLQELGRRRIASPSPARRTRARPRCRRSCTRRPPGTRLSARRRSSTSSWRFTSIANRSMAYSILIGA